MTRLLRIKMAVAGVLGNECACCGQRGVWPWEPAPPMMVGVVPLQVGHPNGRRWSIRRPNSESRWMRYLREALRSTPLVRAECGPCNRKHGGSIRYKGRVDKTRQGARKRHVETYEDPPDRPLDMVSE